MSDAYKNVLGGKLKLKRGGGSAPASAAPVRGAAAQMAAASSLSGAKRKLPEPPSEAAAPAVPVAAVAATALAAATAAAGEADAAPAPAVDRKTPAQRAHEESLRKRQKELVGKMAAKSHREKIEEMNEYLAKLPEHNDLFRISYAGTG